MKVRCSEQDRLLAFTWFCYSGGSSPGPAVVLAAKPWPGVCVASSPDAGVLRALWALKEMCPLHPLAEERVFLRSNEALKGLLACADRQAGPGQLCAAFVPREGDRSPAWPAFCSDSSLLTPHRGLGSRRCAVAILRMASATQPCVQSPGSHCGGHRLSRQPTRLGRWPQALQSQKGDKVLEAARGKGRGCRQLMGLRGGDTGQPAACPMVTGGMVHPTPH